MAESIRVAVRYGGNVYYAAVEGDERADQLLLRSLYHFGIDPTEKKRGWRLVYEGMDRADRGLFLDHSIGEQVSDGGELLLQEDVAGYRRPSTGMY